MKRNHRFMRNSSSQAYKRTVSANKRTVSANKRTVSSANKRTVSANKCTQRIVKLLPMKIFITGGAGRMGSDIIPRLKTRDWDVIAPSSKTVSITDSNAISRTIQETQPEIVLHLAAYTDVAKAEQDHAACYAVNVIGSRNVAKAAQVSGARLVHISTDYVFDGERGMYQETDAPNPSNYYSLTKAIAEEAARAVKNSLIVRTSFKDAIWKYPMAFKDQFTSADYTDVIAAELELLLLNLSRVETDVLHLVTERKSILELAQRRNPHVQAGSRVGAKVHIPPDVSLDNSKWLGFKAGF
jgi:dTDP-4-dehydrorhamnose reductase